MGNNLSEIYRDKPLKEYFCIYGWTPHFRYGASMVTGWRRWQQDRISSLAKFHEDLSLFAVFDGHGGQEASEYLKKNYADHLRDCLKENDLETALYLSFLSCDLSLKTFIGKEVAPIKEAIRKKFKIENPSTMCKSLDFKNAVRAELGKFFQEKSFRGECSKGPSDSSVKPLSKLIASSETMQKLFLEPMNDDDDDEEDKDYNIDEEEMIDDSSSNSSSTTSMSSSPEECEKSEEFAIDSSEVMNLEGPDDSIGESKNDIPDTEQLGNQNCDEDSSTGNPNLCRNEKSVTSKNDSTSETRKIENIVSKDQSKGSSTSNNEDVDANDTKPLVNVCCGSTASVLILSKERAYIANVGDSRCVASVNGIAVDLSKDHHPTDEEELLRIRGSGYSVVDGRIDGLNMSRAFGDFGLKKSVSQAPVDPVLCHPHISVLDINEDLEFIILASDGIWNELSSQDVVNFILERKDEDPADICTELFEVLIPPELTEDGSGCDNMSAILIFFEDSDLSAYVEKTEIVRYSYNRIKKVSKEEDIYAKWQQEIYAKDDSEKEVSKEEDIYGKWQQEMCAKDDSDKEILFEAEMIDLVSSSGDEADMLPSTSKEGQQGPSNLESCDDKSHKSEDPSSCKNLSNSSVDGGSALPPTAKEDQFLPSMNVESSNHKSFPEFNDNYESTKDQLASNESEDSENFDESK